MCLESPVRGSLGNVFEFGTPHSSQITFPPVDCSSLHCHSSVIVLHSLQRDLTLTLAVHHFYLPGGFCLEQSMYYLSILICFM